jgi:hypothetical protein
MLGPPVRSVNRPGPGALPGPRRVRLPVSLFRAVFSSMRIAARIARRCCPGLTAPWYHQLVSWHPACSPLSGLEPGRYLRSLMRIAAFIIAVWTLFGAPMLCQAGVLLHGCHVHLWPRNELRCRSVQRDCHQGKSAGEGILSTYRSSASPPSPPFRHRWKSRSPARSYARPILPPRSPYRS